MNAPCCSPGGRFSSPAAEHTTPALVTENRDLGSLVSIPGGRFLMGAPDAEANDGDGESPVRGVTVDPFRIDAVAVTNARFARFIEATGYVTDAERYGWSFVFHLLVTTEVDSHVQAAAAAAPWWLVVPGASWRSPEGPGSHTDGREEHPVVHVSWNDALAYCAWSGTRLPTEAEWECAARGGLSQAQYPWGDELTPGGEHRCNIWQGRFPDLNTSQDGWLGTAPVDAFRPNEYGLYNVAGNVWEWCSDWFSPDHHLTASRYNPVGPAMGVAKVMRGGSYLCHDSYCNRYRVAARTSNTTDSSAGNIGFRVAAR